VTGRFFNRCEPAPDVADRALARGFWDVCERMTGEHWPADQPSAARGIQGVVTGDRGSDVLGSEGAAALAEFPPRLRRR
jgi:hypothetical protein